MKVQKLGAYIRNQRNGAHMSLRKLSTLAGVSLPYLSQIERGLRRPSAEIMQAIAKALRISANTLYVQAGILDEHPKPDVQSAVMGDTGLTERQKQALLAVYVSFREETSRRRANRKGLPEPVQPNGAAALLEEPIVAASLVGATVAAPRTTATTKANRKAPAVKPATAKRGPAGRRVTGTGGTTTTVRRGARATRSGSTARKRSSGRSETQAETKPSPGSPSASRSQSFEPSKGGATT
jgi:transcriptional regulator with XRE-family HTH domain